MSYWERQSSIDVTVAAVVTAAVWLTPFLGGPVLFRVISAADLGRAWLGPVLSMLGMTATTTAFIFTVIDRKEFAILRGSGSESQLWKIFSQNIGWLAISAIYAGACTFLADSYTGPAAWLGSFLVVMLSICIAKFAWVMRQVIAVRIDQAGLG